MKIQWNWHNNKLKNYQKEKLLSINDAHALEFTKVKEKIDLNSIKLKKAILQQNIQRVNEQNDVNKDKNTQKPK